MRRRAWRSSGRAAGVGPAVTRSPRQTGRAQALGLAGLTQSPWFVWAAPVSLTVWSAPLLSLPRVHLGREHQAKEEKPQKLVFARPKPFSTGLTSWLYYSRLYLYAKLVCRMSNNSWFSRPSYKTVEKKLIPSEWACPHLEWRMNRTGGPTDIGKCHYFNASKWSLLKSLNSYKFAIYFLIRYTGLFKPVKPKSPLYNKNIFQFTSSKEEIPWGWKVL